MTTPKRHTEPTERTPYPCSWCGYYYVAKKDSLCQSCSSRERYRNDEAYAERARSRSREESARKNAQRPKHFTPPT